MTDQQRDDPALLDALVSSYSILSLLHHRARRSTSQPSGHGAAESSGLSHTESLRAWTVWT